MSAEPIRLTVGRGHAKPLWSRHPWVYRSALTKVPGQLEAGAIVDVMDERGRFIGRGLFSPDSAMAVRLLTWEADEAIDAALFERRIRDCQAWRESLGLTRTTNAYRLIHSEGDGLPGLVVDRYGDTLVVQLGTAGMARFQPDILAALVTICRPRAVIARPDARMAKKEGLSTRTQLLHGEPAPDGVVIDEHGLRYRVDPMAGQKTGFYLDQRDNRRRVAEWVAGKRVLDGFSHSAAFAIACRKLGDAADIVAIDSSSAALAMAEANCELNGVADIELERGDVFDRLRARVDGGERFDVVILDPPKYVSSRGGLAKGLNTYRALNTLAMRSLSPNGLLVSCSCSGLVSEESFERVLQSAAIDAGRDLRIIERRGQAPCHPVRPSCLESRYLKCMLAVVS